MEITYFFFYTYGLVMIDDSPLFWRAIFTKV